MLLPDHLHLFVTFSGEPAGEFAALDLSTWMKSLKNALSKALRTAGVASPHWQKGFFDRLLRKEESYAAKWDYVRQNSVRAGLVAEAEAWPFWAQPHALQMEAP